MRPTPVSTFTKNLIGFGVFLAVSFGVTIGVNMLTVQESEDQQVAAAAAKMLEMLDR